MEKICKKCKEIFFTRSSQKIFCKECRDNLICKVEGCNNKVSITKLELCSKHHVRKIREENHNPITICKKCNESFINNTKVRNDYCEECRNRKCKVEGCDNKVRAIIDDLCKKHYLQKLRENDKITYTKICENCSCNFITTNNNMKYCSKDCKIQIDINRSLEKSKKERDEKVNKLKKRTCEICGKKFIPRLFCKDSQHCCSSECREEYTKRYISDHYNKNKEHLRKGQSYPQFYIYNLLKEEFFNLNWEYNNRKIIKNIETGRCLELDIWCPEKKFAIEFDGDQHFKPKYGQKVFEYTVKMDKLKNEECKKLGIRLLRINYSNDWKNEDWLIKKIGEFINDDN